ncbi:MAG TPA: hypothetical protein VLD37_04385 [Candidatus Bilamarchaeum sp.]|nr:hypothetical protein [Candidatus Bilamarchaeum sp.]
MVEITPRLIAKPPGPGKLKSVRREPEELPKFGNALRGQQTYLSSKSPLRCYYYNKQVRGRWSSAERSITGMRWNAYLVSGKTLPKLEPLAPQKMQVVKGIMREIEAGKEKKSPPAIDLGGRGEGRAGLCKAGSKNDARHPESFGGMETGESRPPPQSRKNRTHRQTGTCSTRNEMGARGHDEYAESPRKLASHPEFRHLRIVRETSQREADVLEIRPGVRKSGNMETPLQSEARGHTFQQAATIELHEPLSAPPAHTASGAEVKVTLVHGDADEPALAHSTPPAALLAHMTASFRPGAFPPANDTFVPHEPWPPCAVSARASQHQEVGYISSARRRAFQLKCAQGAAALPQ